MKKELKAREKANWGRVMWALGEEPRLSDLELVQGRLMALDPNNPQTHFAQLTVNGADPSCLAVWSLELQDPPCTQRQGGTAPALPYHATLYLHVTWRDRSCGPVDATALTNAISQQVKINTKHCFAAYDRKGKLVAGDPEAKVNVEEFWVVSEKPRSLAAVIP